MNTPTSPTTPLCSPRARTPFDSPLTVHKIDPSDRYGERKRCARALGVVCYGRFIQSILIAASSA